jgi:hypothetical protein
MEGPEPLERLAPWFLRVFPGPSSRGHSTQGYYRGGGFSPVSQCQLKGNQGGLVPAVDPRGGLYNKCQSTQWS